MSKKLTITLLVTLSLGLVACNNATTENPLTAVDPDTAARFLVEASAQGETAIGHQSSGRGNLYRRCMIQKAEHSVCEQLYPAMVIVAEQTPPFTTLTVADLKNGLVWQSIEEEYGRIYFNRLPD